jgi:hypothetical protein
MEYEDNTNSECQGAPDETFYSTSGVTIMPTILMFGKRKSDEARCKEASVDSFSVLCQQVTSEAEGELKAFIHYR